jgi:hypothetical protein
LLHNDHHPSSRAGTIGQYVAAVFVDSALPQPKKLKNTLHHGLVMASSLSPIISSNFIEHYEKLAIKSAQPLNPCGSNSLIRDLWFDLADHSNYISSATLVESLQISPCFRKLLT